MAGIGAISPPYNEALHLERCTQSGWPFADGAFVVDFCSDDGMPELAARLGATVR